MRNILKLAFFALILGACGSEGETSEETSRPALKSDTETARALSKEIDSLESIVYADTLGSNKPAAEMLLNKYSRYAKLFSADKSKSPEYLYKAAAVARGIGKPVEAIRSYDQILKKYPGFERGPEVAFLIGFTYDADMNDPELAREAYENVVERFPDDHYAVQAKNRLETLGTSDEELIRQFMEKQPGA